jgi:hypothetical protein
MTYEGQCAKGRHDAERVLDAVIEFRHEQLSASFGVSTGFLDFLVFGHGDVGADHAENDMRGRA